MPKRIEYEGAVHEFPDDFTDDDIASALGEAAQPVRFYDSHLESAAAQQPFGSKAATFLSGVPVLGGLVDEGLGRAASLINENTPEENAARIRAMIGLEEKERPKTAFGLKMAGGIVGTTPLIAAAPAAFGATGANLASRSLAGAASGAALGGADAATRGQSAAQGALIGGVVGGAAPAVAAGAGKVAEKIAAALRGDKAAQAALQGLSGEGMDVAAARAQLAGMGDDAMLANLGPNLQRQAGGLAATPGRAQTIVRGALDRQAAGAGQRVETAAAQALGPRQNIVQAADDLILQRAQAATPLYDQAYKTPITVTQKIADLFKAPAVKSAWTKAQRLAANEGIPIDPANIDTRALDYLKRGLDDAIGIAQRRGGNQEARALMGLKDTLVSELDAMNPVYAQARQAFAGPSAMMDALEEGTKIFQRNVSPDALSKTISAMSASERDAFQQGARQQLQNVMGTARNDANAAKALFEQGYNAEKLKLLLGPDAAQSFLKSLGIEKTFQKTANVVAQNSETAARLSAQEALGIRQPGGFSPKNAYEAGGTAGALRAGALRLADKALGSMSVAKQQKMHEALARILTATGPERDAALDSLTRLVGAQHGAQKLGKGTQDAILALLIGSQSGIRAAQ